MRRLDTSLKWQHYAIITGDGTDLRGVLNCMRYDRAYPFEEVDASVLESAHSDRKPFAIVITRFDETTRPGWNFGKWKSHHVELTPITDGRQYNFNRKIGEKVLGT